MEKKICFIINENKLYAEKVLVDYNGFPIFFLCKTSGEYCLVLCTDVKNPTYIIAPISFQETYSLLHGKKPMCDFFKEKENYWEVVSGEDIDSDIITKHPIGELDESVLPKEGACFQVFTDDMKRYVKNFDYEYMKKKLMKKK